MKKLLFILLTLFTLQSFAQTDSVYVKVRNGIPGVYNMSKNAGGDSIVFYVAGMRYAVAAGGSSKINVYKPLYGNNADSSLHIYMSTDSSFSDASDTSTSSSLAIKQYVKTHFQTLDFLNVLDYGATADSNTLCADAINAAINIQSAKGGGRVLIPPGKYIIGKAIKLKDNVTLDATDADIYLKPGSNDYMVRNYDFYNGNKNISVIGGTWHANGASQNGLRINDSTTLDTDFYGYGFVFCRVNNLLVQNLEIDSTYTWGIGHFMGNYETFRNIRFHQMLRFAYNGDGITGFGDNLLIENISGYTNDDMVALIVGTHGGIANHGYPVGHWPLKQNVYNAVIRNVKGELYDSLHAGIDSAYAYRLVRLHAASTDTLFTTFVDGVNGLSNMAPIIIATSYTGTVPGIIKNIFLENISVKSMSKDALHNLPERGLIRVDGVNGLENINISNMYRYNDYGYYPMIGFYNSSIKNLNINNFTNYTSISPVVWDSLSTVKNINISNGINTDTTLTASVPIYKKWNLTDSLTSLNVVNVKNNITDSALNKNSTAKISLRSISFAADTSRLVGKSGDVIYQKGFGLVAYENGKWNTGTSTGNGVGNADSLGGYPASSYYIKSAVDAALTLKANDNAVVHLANTETITGAKTFSGSVVGSGVILNIINNASSADLGLYQLLAPNIIAGQETYMAFGQSASTYNRANISYNHVGDGSSSNFISFGFYGAGNLFNILASGNTGVGTTSPNSKLTVNGSFATAYVQKSTSYTATGADHTIEITATGTTQTLPTAVGISGREYEYVYTATSGTAAIVTTSSQTFLNITGAPTTLTLSAPATGTITEYKVRSNGANWVVISKVAN